MPVAEPIATNTHDHEKAYAILNEMLIALRLNLADSVSMAEELQLIVKEWSKHTCTGVTLNEPSSRSCVDGETVREQLRCNKGASAVMSLVNNATPNEVDLVRKLVDKLATKEGSDEVLQELSDHLDTAPKVDIIARSGGADDDGAAAWCIPPPQSRKNPHVRASPRAASGALGRPVAAMPTETRSAKDRSRSIAACRRLRIRSSAMAVPMAATAVAASARAEGPRISPSPRAPDACAGSRVLQHL